MTVLNEEFGEDGPPPDSNYHSLADRDPDLLWKRAQIHNERRRRSSRTSWDIVFGLWLWLQALPAAIVVLVVLFGWIEGSPSWIEGVFGSILFVFIFATVTLVYWLPTLAAHRRDRTNKWAITLLNFLTGWLFVGWVIAMVWAVSEDKSGRAGR